MIENLKEDAANFLVIFENATGGDMNGSVEGVVTTSIIRSRNPRERLH